MLETNKSFYVILKRNSTFDKASASITRVELETFTIDYATWNKIPERDKTAAYFGANEIAILHDPTIGNLTHAHVPDRGVQNAQGTPASELGARVAALESVQENERLRKEIEELKATMSGAKKDDIRELSEEQQAKVLQMQEEGHSVKEIAKEMPKAVRQKDIEAFLSKDLED